MTATLTATAAADTSGPRGTRVPVTWFYRASVRPCPPPPTTTDQKTWKDWPMTDYQAEAKATCKHFYASHCYRGMSIRLCTICRDPDWDDLEQQLSCPCGQKAPATTDQEAAPTS